MNGAAIPRRASLLSAVSALLVFVSACTGGGGSAYDVTVRFNEQARQDDIDDVTNLIHSYDEDAIVRVQESFPPTAVATVRTNDPSFCDDLERELDQSRAVANSTCVRR
jgi:hypothetical protein